MDKRWSDFYFGFKVFYFSKAKLKKTIGTI